MKKLFLLLIFSIHFGVIASEEVYLDPPMAKGSDQIIDQQENYFQTSTYKIIPNVNPITGDLTEDEVDLVVAGCEPLSVRRFYSHTAPHEPKTGGWRYNPETFFAANFEWKGQKAFASVGEFNGGIISFTPQSGNCTFNAKDFSQFNPNGQTHPLNTKIHYSKINAKEKGFFWWKGGNPRGRWHKTFL